jgi:hypothetical protein
MRRSFSILTAIVLIVAAIAFAIPGTTSQDAAPSISLVPDTATYAAIPGTTVEGFTIVSQPVEPAAETPAAGGGAEATPSSVNSAPMVLQHVTIDPHTMDPNTEHPHGGGFLLTVVSGAICYTQGLYLEATSMVSVHAAAANEVPADCAAPAPECESPSGCQLMEGETVYLPAGSTVVQSNSAWHVYGNVDDVPAVIVLSGYAIELPALPCGGSCWRW